MPERKKDIFIFKKWCYISKQKYKKNKQRKNKLRKWKYICRQIYSGELCSLKLRLKKNVDLKRSIKTIRDNIYNSRIKKISVNDCDNNTLYTDNKMTSEDENVNSLKNSIENKNIMLLFSKQSNGNYIKNKYYDDRISSTNSTCASSLCYDEYAYKSSSKKNNDSDNNNRNIMKKPKTSFPNANNININFLNQIHCSRIVEARSLFTFFYTKLKRKDKDYYKNKHMMHKKSALYMNKLNKEYNHELSKQYIPKNQEQIYNDIKCKPTKAPPSYKYYNKDNQNIENNYNNINHINGNINNGHNNVYANHNGQYSLENEGMKHDPNNFNNNASMETPDKQEHENNNNEENTEMNAERFLDEFDDFDINEKFKEKTYYTDRCMLDRNGKRVSILDQLNINLDDKKNVVNNEELNDINLSSDKNSKVAKKLSLNTNMVTNDRPTVNINDDEADININENEYTNNLKEDNYTGDKNVVKNNVIITNNTSINSKMAHLKKNNKMHPPKKGVNNNIVKEGIKTNDDREKSGDRIANNKINNNKICKINYDMNKKMSHDTSSKIEYNMNKPMVNNMSSSMEYNMNNPMGNNMSSPMEYNMNNPMGYDMNNPMGNSMSSPMEYSMNNPMGYDMNNPMGYNMNNPMGYNMNNPMEYNMSNQMDLINNYTGNMNNGNFNVPMMNPLWNGGEYPMHNGIQGNFSNMNNMNNVNQVRQGNNQMVPHNQNDGTSVNMNNRNLVLYNNDNIKYDEDFTLNYILQKCEDDDHFFSSNNNNNYEENIDDKKKELQKYTEGMNKLVEQMYFYDNYHEELKICDKDEMPSSNTYNIIDTSLNIDVVDGNDEEKESKEIISQMKLKIMNLEEKLEELKNKKTEGENNLNESNDKKQGDESQNNKIINELKKEIENIKKKRRKKKHKKKKEKEKKKQTEENKEQKDINEDKNNEEIKEQEKGENEEINNFNIDDIIDTDNLNNLKNEIMNNVYYYIYESYDQKDYDILENLAKKHETKGRKICYNVNLPKSDFKNKRTSSLWFLNPAYENYVLEKKKTQKIRNSSSASYERLEFLFNSNDMNNFNGNEDENKSVLNSDIRDSEFSYETFISEKKKKIKKNKINLMKMKNSLTLRGKSENNILNKNSMNNLNKYALEDANREVAKKEENLPQVAEVNPEGNDMVNDLLDTINNYVPDRSIFGIFNAPPSDVKGKEKVEPGETNENEKVENKEKDVDDIFKEVEAKINSKLMKEIEEKKRERELLDLEIENKKKKKELEELELQLMENKRKSLLASKNINEIESEVKLNKNEKEEKNSGEDIQIDKQSYEKANETIILDKAPEEVPNEAVVLNKAADEVPNEIIVLDKTDEDVPNETAVLNKIAEEAPNEQVVKESKQVETENNRKSSDVNITNDILNDYVKTQKKKERKKNNWALYGRPKVNKERNRILRRLSSSKSDGGFNDYANMAERFFEIVTGYTSDQDIEYDDIKENDDINNENERIEERKKKMFNIRIRMKENVYKNDAFYKLGRPKYTKYNIYHRSKSITHNTILKKNSIKNKKGKNVLLKRSKSKNKISKCCQPNIEIVEKTKMKLKEKMKEKEIENSSIFNNLISKNVDNIKKINIINELIKGVNINTYLVDNKMKENFDLKYKRKLIYEDLEKTDADVNLEKHQKLNNEKEYYLKYLNKGKEQTTKLGEHKEDIAEKANSDERERLMMLEEEEKMVEEMKRIEEKRLESMKRIEEEKRMEEEKMIEEMKRLEHTKRIEEEKRLEEEKMIEEMKRLEEEKILEEMKRLKEEKRLEEVRKIAEEKRLEEVKRIEEEEKYRMDEWKDQQNKIEQLKRYEEARKLKERKMIQSAKELMELNILQGTKNLENKIAIEKESVQNDKEINKIEEESGVKENIFSNVLEKIYKNTATPLLNHIKGNKTEESEKGKASLLYIVETKVERKDDGEVELNEVENENDQQSGKEKKMPNISCTKNYEIFDKMEKDRKRMLREKKGSSRITSNKTSNRTLLNNAYVNNSLIINNIINKSKEDKNAAEADADAMPNKELYSLPKKTVEDASMNTLGEDKKRMLLKIRNNNLKYNSLKEENIRDLVEMGLTHSISMEDKIDDLFEIKSDEYDDKDDIFISGTEESFLKIEDNDNIDLDEFKTHVYKESYRKGLLNDKKDVREYFKNNYEAPSFKSDNIYNENIIMGSDEIKNVIMDNYSNNNDTYGKSISVDIDLKNVLNSFKLKEYEKEIVSNKSYEDIDNKEDYVSKNSEDFYFNFERENMENKKKNKNNHSNKQYNDMSLSKLDENNSELSSDNSIKFRQLNTYGSSGSYAFNFNKKSEEDDPYINYSFEKLLSQNAESDNYGINSRDYQSQNMSSERNDILKNTINQLNKLKKTIKTAETGNYYNTEMDEQNMSNIFTDDLKQDDDLSSYSYLSPRKVFNKTRGKYYANHYSRYYS
ncbi:conserved Plasmodium protein, unknown function [Plasmodium chabaudi chabaudi]|uniref:Uncharacterized protein n=1 Tax=Plasmodium chabaudi chabaudi TaxID=31271 RepID=A0A4V0K5C6_PLACU|nr:conserved Plasmodium protein, unknown function [Plasmodium chabaudi chabaudi]VTZ67663.1 conserved Plasmodium protein, unknown function [Plasmodium chabaudi chabaudi]|eukprot:XP_016653406.1 conserved Plasmodium protein, unknown function [Plasmodium chabaudi chabaudi]